WISSGIGADVIADEPPLAILFHQLERGRNVGAGFECQGPGETSACEVNRARVEGGVLDLEHRSLPLRRLPELVERLRFLERSAEIAVSLRVVSGRGGRQELVDHGLRS